LNAGNAGAHQLLEGRQRSLGPFADSVDDLLAGHRGHVADSEHAKHVGPAVGVDDEFAVTRPLDADRPDMRVRTALGCGARNTSGVNTGGRVF
jgi:hypothetical protein